MADFIYKFIPMNMDKRFDVVEKDLKTFFGQHIDSYEKLHLRFYESIQFIDCGQRFESVVCNHCQHSVLKVWGELMDKSYQTGFSERHFITPCCHQETTLDQLIYYGDSGFATCSIDVWNPSEDIDDIEIQVLEKLFGCEYKCVISHI